MIRKKLRLDDLSVEGFVTVAQGQAGGTVLGAQQCTCYTDCTCPGCPTCDGTCQETCEVTCGCDTRLGTCDRNCASIPCYNSDLDACDSH